MERNEILKRLQEKLEKNLADIETKWYALPRDALIGHAEEINATRIVYNELHSGWAYADEKLEFLLRFEDPLEVVRDKWIEEQCPPDISEEMNHALGSVMTDPDAEQVYEMDKGDKQAGMDRGVTMC